MDKGHGVRKLCVILILAVVFLALVVGACWRNLRKGVSVDDKFYYKVSDTRYRRGKDDEIRLHKNGDETEFQLRLNGREQSVKMLWSDNAVTFTYEDGTVVSGIWNGQALCDENGIPFLNMRVEFVDGKSVYDAKMGVSNSLCRISQGVTEFRGSIVGILVGVAACLGGVWTLMFPNETHFFLLKWAYKEPELSESGLFFQRLGGGILLVVGIVIMYIGV